MTERQLRSEAVEVYREPSGRLERPFDPWVQRPTLSLFWRHKGGGTNPRSVSVRTAEKGFRPRLHAENNEVQGRG